MRTLSLPADFPLPAMIRDLADGDTMHQGDDAHYIAVGLSALDIIVAALDGRTPKKIMDMPSGFGRVTRMLRARYPDAQITVCDLDRPAVDFAAKIFRARPLYSVEDLGLLRLDETYDLIWVGSLITHLSEPQTRAFLKTMAGALTPGGKLVASVHGPSITPGLRGWGYGLEPRAIAGILDDYKRHGYGHRGYDNSAGYGISLTDKFWWRDAITDSPFSLTSYQTQAWDKHQDIVVLQRRSLLEKFARPRGEAPAPARIAASRNEAAAYDPVMAIFDTDFYLAANPDVAHAVAAGQYGSAYQHYMSNGRAEGRAVCAGEVAL